LCLWQGERSRVAAAAGRWRGAATHGLTSAYARTRGAKVSLGVKGACGPLGMLV